MLLTKYIEELNNILEKEGDLEVVYASDDEGNSYQKVSFSPSLGYFEDLESFNLYRIDEAMIEEYETSGKAIIIN